MKNLARPQVDASGEFRDPDSGLLHAAHAAWNALARLDLELRAATRPGPLGAVCAHGQLARSCQLCELIAEAAR